MKRQSTAREAVLAIASALIGTTAIIVCAELALRLAPVRDTGSLAVADDRYRLNHFQPHGVVTWTTGWNFRHRVEKTANDYGYLSDRDFGDRRGRLLAVIGDSYVEALQVRNGESVAGVLDDAVSRDGRVYGIGSSGASLASYLAMARFARDEFSPDAVSFVIVMNDFDESSCTYANLRGYTWCFDDAEGAAGPLVAKREPERSAWRRLASRSALLRYLAFNVGLDPSYLRARLDLTAPAATRYVGNMPVAVEPAREAAASRAIDRFLAEVSDAAGLPPERILLVVDGIRERIYEGMNLGQDSYAERMRAAFISRAGSAGFPLLDLQAPLAADYAAHHQAFEFGTDRHWNRVAHFIAAEAMAGTPVFAMVFPSTVRLPERPGP